MIISLCFTCGAGMNDYIAKPIHVDEPLLISKKNCNYSVATVKVLNSYEYFLFTFHPVFLDLFSINISLFSMG